MSNFTAQKHASPGGKRSPLILALTGRPDVGKDTIGEALQQQGFARVAFADALRREVAEAWRIDPRILTDRATKEWPLPALAAGMCSDPGYMRWVADSGESLTEPRSPRWTLQQWATHKRRFIPDYYARIVERWIGRQSGCGWSRIVVTDLRDAVEEAMLRRLGAIIVRVHRPDATPLPAETAAHTSEQHARIRQHADIVNDGSLHALAEAAFRLVEQLQAEAA